MRNGLLKFIAIIIIGILSIGFLVGCKKNGSKDIEKPDIHTALAEYQQLSKKKSVFEAGIKFTMFRFKENAPYPVSFGQLLSTDRVLNDGRIYMEAALGSYGVSENLVSMLEEINSLLPLITKGEETNSIDPEVFEYINGNTRFVGKLGYDGIGTYNAKGDYILKDKVEEFFNKHTPTNWVSIDDQSILNLQRNFGYNGEILLKDYLMFSTMIDLSPTAGWIMNDIAGKQYNEEQEAFVYSITTLGSKLKAFILDALNKQSEGFDEEQYAEDLQLYAQIIPMVSGWIKASNSNIDAKVDKNGKLQAFSSSMQIDIDIKLDELWDIARLILPQSEHVMIGLVDFFLGSFFRSSSGGKGIWSIRIELTTDEWFYYDDESLNLSKVDTDLFLPNSEEHADRYEIRITPKD